MLNSIYILYNYADALLSLSASWLHVASTAFFNYLLFTYM